MSDLRRDADEALHRLFASVEADLSLDERGMVSIGLEPGLEITLEVPAAGTTVFAHATIMHLRPAGAEVLLRRALRRNLFGLGPPASWIALEEETQSLVFCATLCVADGFGEARLGAFLEEMLETLRGLVHELGVETGGAGSRFDVASDSIMIRG